MQEQILEFLRGSFRASLGARPLTADTPLFSSSIVDSFGVLELITYLEQAFGVDIDPARHELSEFDTVHKIVALVDKLHGSRRDA